ncbi:MAG: AgmX/PglI C-terminal domain-containing protein, partial [Gammaproteobacteria bacterium]
SRIFAREAIEKVHSNGLTMAYGCGQTVQDLVDVLGGLDLETAMEETLNDMDGIAAELENLGAQRETYQLLEQACGSLEKLEELGASSLFWGDGSSVRTADHVREARERAGGFLGKIGEIESRRESLVGELAQGQDVLDILEADLFEFELAEEERAQEWEIVREVSEPAPSLVAAMPWSTGEDDKRFRKTLGLNMLIALLLGAIMPMIDIPLPEFEIIPEVPERFARLIQQELPPPPPPAVIEEPAPEEAVEPEPEPVLVEEEPEVIPEVQPEIVAETPVEPAPTAVEEPAPQQEVRSSGILAFRENFANLSDSRPSARLGAEARINDAGDAAVGRTERAMVTSQAPGSSGGINLSSLSRDVGGGGAGGDQIGGVQVSRVASSIGGTGTSDRPTAGGAAAGRTDEEIQIVFDRYKSALYRLYNRELRNDPTLRGQIVLRLTIEPDGSVSFCEVQSSGLGAPALEQQIVDRVKTFDFGAKEGIAAITILYPIDFLPAA